MLSRYLLLHDSARGLEVYKFQTHKDLKKLKLVGVTFGEDATKELRDLLLFLGVPLEWNDHVILKEDVPVLGEW